MRFTEWGIILENSMVFIEARKPEYLENNPQSMGEAMQLQKLLTQTTFIMAANLNIPLCAF